MLISTNEDAHTYTYTLTKKYALKLYKLQIKHGMLIFIILTANTKEKTNKNVILLILAKYTTNSKWVECLC